MASERDELSTLLEKAYCAFKSDLPKLLETHPRQWVAYRGSERIGFGTSKSELTEKCINRGYCYEELLVRMVQPDISAARIS